ncbi:UNVERIFIED_CONTAM: hypothetical protein PYX00_008544 [Menopon gallinae]|uniref:Gustatory receptor n=1 Tax=Menopon gallinae TaxID=328185 RepID=A0AAW2HNS3_9NEOP
MLFGKLIKDEVENASTILYSLYAGNEDVEIEEQVDIMSLQLSHRKGEFDACGFFKLNFTYFVSTCAVVITYSIIIVQFEEANRIVPETPLQSDNFSVAHSPLQLVFSVFNIVSSRKNRAGCVTVRRGGATSNEDRSALRYYYVKYSTILNVFEDVNDCFGEVNLFSLSYSLFTTFTTIVFYIKRIGSERELLTTLDAFYNIFFFQNKAIFCMLITKLIKQEVEYGSAVLYDLYAEIDDADIQEEVEILSLQLFHRKVVFDACGFFDIDFGLFLSMVGAIITYSVILIQFDIDMGSTPGKFSFNQTVIVI